MINDDKNLHNNYRRTWKRARPENGITNETLFSAARSKADITHRISSDEWHSE